MRLKGPMGRLVKHLVEGAVQCLTTSPVTPAARFSFPPPAEQPHLCTSFEPHPHKLETSPFCHAASFLQYSSRSLTRLDVEQAIYSLICHNHLA